MAGPGRQRCTRSHPKQVGTTRGHRDPAARGGHGRLCLHGAAPLHPAGTAQGRRSQSRGQGVSQPPPQREKLLPRCGDRSPLAGMLWPHQRCRPCCQHRMDTQLCCEMCVWGHTWLPPPGRPRGPCSPRQAGTSTSECKKPLWVPQPSPNPGLTLRPRPPGPPLSGAAGGRGHTPGQGPAARGAHGPGVHSGEPQRSSAPGLQAVEPEQHRCRHRDCCQPAAQCTAQTAPARSGHSVLPDSPVQGAGWGPFRVHPKPVLTAAARLSCLRTR